MVIEEKNNIQACKTNGMTNITANSMGIFIVFTTDKLQRFFVLLTNSMLIYSIYTHLTWHLHKIQCRLDSLGG